MSLVELLVVIAVMTLLSGLLLGAVQKVRAAAGRTSCQNNLKQIGLALHQYHDSVGHLPAGVSDDRPTEPMPFASWCLRLLPYLEQEALFREAVAAFRQERNFMRDPPHAGLRTPVRSFACPADDRVRQARAVGPQEVMRAFTSYLGVTGSRSSSLDGVLYLNSHVLLAEITDGTSNTLAVGERPPSHDLVLGWWYAGWGQNKDGDADMLLSARPNNQSIYGRGCPEGPYEFRAGRVDDQCDAFHMWSLHPGGANFLMADGSVRFLSYAINDILPSLASRAGGEAVSVP